MRCRVFTLLLSCISPFAFSLTVENLRTEYLEQPLAIAVAQPRLSWKLAPAQGERDVSQQAYHIEVSSDATFASVDLWDSGEVKSSATDQVVYQGKKLNSRQQAFWRCRIADAKGTWSEWSKPTSWTVGLLAASDWSAQWISAVNDVTHVTSENIQNFIGDPAKGKLTLTPANHFRKEFTATKTLRSARLYSTALGIVDVEINGQHVADDLFHPGWTNYHKRLHYRAYDVTKLIKNGGNAIAATLADGWYSGYVAYGLLVGVAGVDKEYNGRYYYGKTPAFKAQLELTFDDGSQQTIVTDTSWKTATGAYLEADLLMGETYDARKEYSRWSEAGFGDQDWKNATVRVKHDILPEPHPAAPVRTIEEIKPISVREHSPGVFIYDLGQNISGNVRLKVKGKAGDKVTLRYAEMLHNDGRLSTENLRCARATDVFILKGDQGGETYSPRFTFHGFQYIEVKGYPGKPDLDSITGLVQHTDLPVISTFACSDPMLNKLYQNVLWTQRANHFEIPTDCPQRDERMGWTGDAQAYVRTATYNADISAFYTKWLRDLNDDQWPTGAYPNYAPLPYTRPNEFQAAGWMDAGVICPWTIWQVYGDTHVLREHWEKMTKFMAFRASRDPQLQGSSDDAAYGDWLSLSETKTPIPFIDLAYHARCCDLMVEMARVLGKDEQVALYQKQGDAVRASFQKLHMNENGTMKIDNQTTHVLALYFHLLPKEKQQAAADRLATLIRENGNKMNTGFLGTRPLLPVLSAHGHHDLAGILMQQKEYPSWGYEVENGATTIWERWNSYIKGKGVHEPSMNSFSHYAFGAVHEWMMSTLVGIDLASPGYNEIALRPRPTGTITQADGSTQTRHGKVAVAWEIKDGLHVTCTIPPNTRASVEIPNTWGKTLVDAKTGTTIPTGVRGNSLHLTIGSGTYSWKTR